MKIYGNEISIHKGETFGIDYTYVTNDMIGDNAKPFIMTNVPNITSSKKAYALLSIIPVIQNLNNPYKLNHWLPLEHMPGFDSTVPVDISGFFEEGSTPTSWDDISLPATYHGSRTSSEVGATYIVPNTTDDEYTTHYYADSAVFYWYHEGTNTVDYKYWEYDTDDPGVYTGDWVDYEFRVIDMFTRDETSEFVPQSYLYNIDYILGTVDSTVTDVSDDLEGLPITVIDVSIPLTTPTKLSVLAISNGGI